MLYIVKRTQLYLDDSIFRLLLELSRVQKTTISELVRQAIDQVYARGRRKKDAIKALEATFGMWSDRSDLPPTEEYIRDLRKDTRAKRLGLE